MLPSTDETPSIVFLSFLRLLNKGGCKDDPNKGALSLRRNIIFIDSSGEKNTYKSKR